MSEMAEMNTNQTQEAGQPAQGISTEGQAGEQQEATKPDLTRVKVNGKEMELTQEQMAAYSQKFLSGEDNMRKAAAHREETLQASAQKQSYSEIGELLTKAIQENDWGAARTAMIQLGYPEQQVDAQINKVVQAQRRPAQAQQGRQAPVSTEVQQLRTEMGQLVDIVKALGEKTQTQEQQLDKLDSAHLDRMATDIKGQVRQTAQNHGKLGAYLMKTGPRADRIHDMVWAAVQRRANEDGNQGLPALTENAIAEVLASVHDLDIPTGVEVPQIPGIGPTPGSSTPYPTEAPKPAKIDDRGYGQNVLQRLQAEIVRRHMESA